jgi:squalene-hopene/tetraprenyl-beta-curcumene cyclase
LRCLESLGIGADDARVAGAIEWLRRNPERDKVPGFSSDADGESWSQGLRYYFYSSLATPGHSQLLPEQIDELRGDIVVRLCREQKPDGSWVNSFGRMREDDPLIATCFAIIALARLTDGEPLP